MQETDLAFAGVARQAELVRAGEVSPRELVELALERIGALDPALNAFRAVHAERALEEAGAAGEPSADRPLHGVPVAIKDDQAVEGEPVTLGSNAYGEPQRADSEIVRRLRAAGAIVVGITRVPELTQWPFTETAAGGITRNPWDVQRTPGGSSGGSAAAVASGMVPVATASDGAGSIRIPAACCGLFGLKPQRGRVPTAPKAEMWLGLGHLGVLTRSVRDSALVYEALTQQPWTRVPGEDPGRLRIAVSTKLPLGFVAPLGAEPRAAIDRTVAALRELGHEVIERDPDYPPATGAWVVARYLRGIHDDARAMPHPERLERRTRQMVRRGALLGWAARRARAAEAADTARINRIFDDVDLLLLPALASLPLPVGRFEGRGATWTVNGSARFTPWTGAFNHTGQPAASVPAGFTQDGIPVAVQLVSRPHDEETILRVAAQLEAARPWADRRPAIA